MADDAVDLREYLGVVRRRRWLIVIVTVVVTFVAAAYSLTRTPVYTAQASVLVQPAIDSTQYRPDQLVSLDTEARIASSAPVARIADRTLASSLQLNDLLKHVDVSTSPDTLVLDIFFTDTSPRVAADGANAFANAYLEYKRDAAVSAAADKRSQVQSTIDELQKELDQVEKVIEVSPEGSTKLQDAEAQRSTLNAQVVVLTTQLAESVAVTDPGEVILNATIPERPSSPKLTLNVALGLFVGLFLGVLLAFVRDRTDERIRSRDALESAVDAPVLATIPKAAAIGRKDARWLVTERQPRSPAAEAYRLLRTSVMAANRSRGAKVFAVVSPMLGEGKTTTTANLAAALSHTDNQVVVVSADLRKPTLHRYFDHEGTPGLADVLRGRWTLADSFERVAPNLRLLPSGDPPQRPAELLQSQAMTRLFPMLRERFDFIIVDCPPVLGLADSLSIAPLADAVILVVRAESSKQHAVVHAVEQLEQVGAVVWGTVLNDAPMSKTTAYGYGYGYGYGYEDEAEEETAVVPAENRPGPAADGASQRPGVPSSGGPNGNGSAQREGSQVPAAGPASDSDADRGRRARSRNRKRDRLRTGDREGETFDERGQDRPTDTPRSEAGGHGAS